ncbi:Fc.00g010180.m01.CDS01 [Cosmosporella sp. VM-42]
MLQKMPIWQSSPGQSMLRRVTGALKLLAWPVVLCTGFSYDLYLVWFNPLNATASIILSCDPYHFGSSIVRLCYMSCRPLGMKIAARQKLRTKTGCLTCRKRRKKCDENDPVCDGCESSGRECHWPLPADLLDRRYASHYRSRHRENVAKYKSQHTINQTGDPQMSAEVQPDVQGPSHCPWHSATTGVHLCPPSPLTEVAVAHSAISQHLEVLISRHFVDRYYSLLLLPSCHPGIYHGWLTEIQKLTVSNKSLHYSALACAASHIYSIDASWRMHDLALTYYSNALRELSKLLATTSQPENHNGVLMSVILLYLHGFMGWGTDTDIPRHFNAATRILTLRLLDRPIRIHRIFDRLAVESVMYQIYVMTMGLWSDPTGPDRDFDRNFWDRAERALNRSTFSIGTSIHFTSPILGVSLSLYGLALSLRQYYRTGCSPDLAALGRIQSEVAAWEAIVLYNQELQSGPNSNSQELNSQERCFRDASYLYAIVASLLLEQLLQQEIKATLPSMVPSDSWQMKMAVQILKQHQDDNDWPKSFIGDWPIYTLGFFMTSSEDRKLVRAELQRRWDLAKFAQVIETARHPCVKSLDALPVLGRRATSLGSEIVRGNEKYDHFPLARYLAALAELSRFVTNYATLDAFFATSKIAMALQKDIIHRPTDMEDVPNGGASEDHMLRGMDLAAFDGSFAPGTRPTTRRVVPWYKDRDYFFGCWLLPAVWKSAFIEGVATCCLVYVSGQITATLLSYETPQLGAYIGISNIVLLSTFIYATAAPSGGHINPLITFSAIFAGICPLSRGILYLCFQTIGAALGGGILAGVWGHERAISVHGGGCFFDSSQISTGQVFLNEVFASFVLLYLSYGVGLDPRQAILFGPRLGPLLVGTSLGLVTFATSGIAPGYAGAQMNPARCFAYGIARRNMSDQWIWWFGPAAAALLLAVMYNIAPLNHDVNDHGEDTRPLPTLRGGNV